MAGLVPAIHVLLGDLNQVVDARDKPGHDDGETNRPDILDQRIAGCPTSPNSKPKFWAR
jgi:hypothetical protein